MSYEDELRAFREVLDGPTIGAGQAGELAQLRALVHRYPDKAAEHLAELRGSV